jgi:hypothetical protein
VLTTAAKTVRSRAAASVRRGREAENAESGLHRPHLRRNPVASTRDRGCCGRVPFPIAGVHSFERCRDSGQAPGRNAIKVTVCDLERTDVVSPDRENWRAEERRRFLVRQSPFAAESLLETRGQFAESPRAAAYGQPALPNKSTIRFLRKSSKERA